MTDTCPICQHPKIEAINSALSSGRYVAVVARQYRLETGVLTVHAHSHIYGNLESHPTLISARLRRNMGVPGMILFPKGHERLSEADVELIKAYIARLSNQSITREDLQTQEMPAAVIDVQVTENPMRQFTRAIDTAVDAYQLAHDDPRMQAHMRERLRGENQANDSV